MESPRQPTIGSMIGSRMGPCLLLKLRCTYQKSECGIGNFGSIEKVSMAPGSRMSFMSPWLRFHHPHVSHHTTCIVLFWRMIPNQAITNSKNRVYLATPAVLVVIIVVVFAAVFGSTTPDMKKM